MNSGRPFADEPIELTAKFTIESAEIEAELAQFMKKDSLVRRSQLVILVMGLYVGYAVVLTGVAVPLIGVPKLLCMGAGIVAVFALFAVTQQPRNQARLLIKTLKRIAGDRGDSERFIEVTASTLTTSTSESRCTYALRSVQRVDCGKGLLILRIGPMMLFLIVPATADFGQETFETFVEKLKALHTAARKAEAS